LYGTTSSAYGGVLGFWDDKIDRFLDTALTPGTTVIVTSDHGNDLNGSHGGSGDIYRRVPVLMWGAGISPGAKFEMQAVEMPATIAVLLGIRAPSDAVALPAVDALQIPPAERYRILRVAYAQAVLKNPRVTSNPSLLAQAQAGFAPNWTGSEPANAGPNTSIASGALIPAKVEAVTAADPSGTPDAGSPADMKAVDDNIARLQASFDELRPELVPQRGWHVSDWMFVAIAFLSAVGLVVVSGAAVRWPGHSFSVRHGLVAAAFLSIEALLVVRFGLMGTLKSALAHRSPGIIAAAFALLIAGADLCLVAWRRRDSLFRWAESHVVTVTLLGWLLISALRPVTAIGFVGLVTTLAVLHASDWTARERFAIGFAFTGYFIVGSLLIWPHCGESIFARYVVGAPIALIGGALLFLAQKRRTGAQYSFAWAMLAVLAAFPAGATGFTGWSNANPVALASLMTVAFCYGMSRIVPIPMWVWLAPAGVLAFWWFPHSTLFYAAFALCAGVLAASILQNRLARACSMGTFVSTLCLLLIMSPPSKCLTLLVYCGALVAFLFGKPIGASRDRFIALTALMIAGVYFAIFNLFTGRFEGMLFVDMGSLDLSSAYVGDPTRTIVPAILMAAFKAWLLFFLLAISIGLLERLRRDFAAIAGLAGTLLLLNVAQLSVLTAMSVHSRSQLYDTELFSLLLTTAMFVFGASAVGAVAWIRSDMTSSQPVLEPANATASTA
jgi:hypothetical protein